MEHRIHHQRSTKKLFNKLFHPGNSKKSQVSPSSSPPENNHEWVPAYMSVSYNQYEHEKPGNRSTPNSPSALITTHYNSYTTEPTLIQSNKSRNKATITSHSDEDYHSDDDDNSTIGRTSILTSSSSTCSIQRSGSVQRRYSFSNIHESGRQRLIAAKRAEYQEKMDAFDDLIQRRRGSTLRLALAPDVASY
jgi:hypothetical protein